MNEQTVRFMRRNGKVVPIKTDRYKINPSGADYSRPKAIQMIKSEIQQMNWEIKQSQAGQRIFMESEYGGGPKVIGQKSTFPKYFRELKFGSKKDFLKVVSNEKGKRYERIKSKAIERLEKGYKNQHGFDMPSMEFKVASRQIFDNKDIIFRKINGKIVPLRIQKKNRYDLHEEAPF